VSQLITGKIEIPESTLTFGARIDLGLGKVYEMAEVAVKDEIEDTAWKPRYRVDITDAVKPSENALSIQVLNLWPDRLIGYQRPE
jgi:hypothetical protein